MALCFNPRASAVTMLADTLLQIRQFPVIGDLIMSLAVRLIIYPKMPIHIVKNIRRCKTRQKNFQIERIEIF